MQYMMKKIKLLTSVAVYRVVPIMLVSSAVLLVS